jgi:hypothetical protein
MLSDLQKITGNKIIHFLVISDISFKKEGLCWSTGSPASICLAPRHTRHDGRRDVVCASNGVTYASYNDVACLRIYNDGECSLVTSSDFMKNIF